MKKYLFVIIALLLAVYITASYFYFSKNNFQKPQVCTDVEIVITDSAYRQFITSAEVQEYLIKNRLWPLNKKFTDINTHSIEKSLQKNEIIDKADVVKKISGTISIVLSQKMPILRIFTTQGSYYVDVSGRVMPLTQSASIYTPVASGNISKAFATGKLYSFALYLQQNPFWDSQIEQIYVRTETDVEIVPRIGKHRIMLGSLDDYETKLERLRLFYEQAIPRFGWDKYSVINLKYRNQIVCTKN